MHSTALTRQTVSMFEILVRNFVTEDRKFAFETFNPGPQSSQYIGIAHGHSLLPRLDFLFECYDLRTAGSFDAVNRKSKILPSLDRANILMKMRCNFFPTT